MIDLESVALESVLFGSNFSSSSHGSTSLDFLTSFVIL